MMKVIKRNGDVEEFKEEKVVQSLENSGVSEETIKKVVNKILERGFKKISTDKLYKLVYKLVKKYESKYSASIYSLKKALLELGPDGYLFEDFIGRILEYEGYEIKRKSLFESLCVTHELDVVGDDFFVECKYHNKGGVTTGIKDVMYSYARFLDLKHASEKKSYDFKKVWFATNTGLSDDAKSYGEYWGMKLISWKHKGDWSLAHLVDANQYYPITLLPSVNKTTINKLCEHDLIIIRDLQKKSNEELKSMGLNLKEVNKIREDITKIVKASKKIRKAEVNEE